jgi:hypothetical protein
VNISQDNLYYNVVKQISNPDSENGNLYLNDYEFKYMLKNNQILYNYQTREIQQIAQIKTGVSNLNKIVIAGFVLVTTAIACNAIVLYKRK